MNFIHFRHFCYPPSKIWHHKKNNALIRSSERLTQASECHLQSGNAGYMTHKTMIQYITTGLSVCQTTDPAKYNDYVVYTTVTD